MAPKKILVDNDLKFNSASLKSRITKKNKPIFVDNSQEEVSKPISYYYFDLEPLAVFNSVPVKPMKPVATIFIQKATQKDLS